MNNLLFPEHEWDYVDRAIERVKIAWNFHHMMNPNGEKMLLAFSGGKDSICLFFVCKRASEELGIPMEDMFHVQYNITNVDPPELVRFIRDVMKRDYPFIVMHHPKKTMWQLIATKKIPPTRIARYCCSNLKEISRVRGGYTLTGVRHAESVRRAGRDSFEIVGKSRKEAVYLGDNISDEREMRYCMQTESYMCNPIIDWSDDDVWHFIRGNDLPYCKLYDEGWERLGCIGCPMAPIHQREFEFQKYPKFADCYKRAFTKMLATYSDSDKVKRVRWKDAEDVFHWWIYEGENSSSLQDESLF